MSEFSWTAEAVEDLKKYWDEGLSKSEIAKKLGAPSVNCVVGKAYRLKLPARKTQQRAAGSAKKPAAKGKSSHSAAKPKRPKGGKYSALLQPVVPRSQTPRKPKKDEAKPSFTCRGVTLLELADGQCKTYLMPGDDRFDLGGQALYCGNPAAKEGGSICVGHLERLKASNGKVKIGHFTDLHDRGLSRYRPMV